MALLGLQELFRWRQNCLLLLGTVAVISLSAGGCRSCSTCHDYGPPVANCDCNACGMHRAGSASCGCSGEPCTTGTCSCGSQDGTYVDGTLQDLSCTDDEGAYPVDEP